MTAQTHPLVLPDWLVATYQLDLTLNYSAGWGFHHRDVAFSPTGDMYALSTIWRYRPDGGADPAERSCRGGLITRYAPDGTPMATTLVGMPHPDGTPSAVSNGADGTGGVGLCVLPDGTVVLTTRHDGTYLLDRELRTLLASYTRPPYDRDSYGFNQPLGTSFAGRIRVTPGGRLLCVLDEYGVDRYGALLPNLLAVADGGLSAAGTPDLDVIAAADGAPHHQTPDHVRPFARYQGRPVGFDHRPAPDLGELTAQRWPEVDWWRHPPTLRTPEPLGDDLFVVPLFGHLLRGGNRGRCFVFALVDDRGTLVGRLEGLDFWQDSPFTGEHYTVVTDPGRRLAFHLNRYGLYAWDADGTLLGRVSTEDKPFKALTNFQLLGCSPAGDLILVHDKQHLLLRVPVPDMDLGSAVSAALQAYTRERTSLKKTFPQTNWHWTHPQVHHL